MLSVIFMFFAFVVGRLFYLHRKLKAATRSCYRNYCYREERSCGIVEIARHGADGDLENPSAQPWQLQQGGRGATGAFGLGHAHAGDTALGDSALGDSARPLAAPQGQHTVRMLMC